MRRHNRPSPSTPATQAGHVHLVGSRWHACAANQQSATAPLTRDNADSSKLSVAEPLLELSSLSAQLDGGSVSAGARVDYQPKDADAHTIRVDADVKQVNPAIFALDEDFPASGLFDLALQLNGEGPDLQSAIERADSQLLLDAKEGVFTAFEMDDQLAGLGMLGGFLGSQLDRPGLAAVTEAIPYFQDIRFSSLSLDLDRARSGRISVNQISMLSELIRFDGGAILASSWTDILSTPMDLRLQLGSKGRWYPHSTSLLYWRAPRTRMGSVPGGARLASQAPAIRTPDHSSNC